MTIVQPKYQRSQQAYARAVQRMPGGVSSPVRAYKAVGGQPIFADRGQGAWVIDLDGNRYVDYVGSYGPLIFGHAQPQVVQAVAVAAARGMTFGMPTEAESTLAELICTAVPSIERVRFVNSGTEATMSAIRLARAATGRDRIIKFTGCYHGHSDGLLVQAGSGAATLGMPSSPGVPASVAQNTLVLPYNDLDAVRQAFAQAGASIAGIIVEPIAGNMGCVPPRPGYLEGLRQLCDQHGALLIFDEVMTGFRVALGGAQQLYNIRPDLTCLGKIVGGGLPCAAYGGSAHLMKRMAPEGPVYQAGTLSGNPLAMAAGIATLTQLREPGFYDQLDRVAGQLIKGVGQIASSHQVPVQTTRVGSMVCCFFADSPVESFEQALMCDTQAFGVFFQQLLRHGVMLPPSQFETWFVSGAHDQVCIEHTLAAADHAMREVARSRS